MTANGNLLKNIPEQLPQEFSEILLNSRSFHLERIVSLGQATPAGEWYDQDTHEWVLLVSGRAGLRFAREAAMRLLSPGDYVHIPAHCRHRVEWTDPDQPTVWLALHYRG
jgi:cupin 2 domain-containing protein